jgi:hypothetical protein
MKPVLPTGRSVTTLLNAIVDAPSVAFCFAKSDAGVNSFVGDPRPANGVTYGKALVIESVDGVDHDSEGLVPFALAGELDLIESLGCAEAVAKAEEEMTRARSMPLGRSAVSGEGGDCRSRPYGSPLPPTPFMFTRPLSTRSFTFRAFHEPLRSTRGL